MVQAHYRPPPFFIPLTVYNVQKGSLYNVGDIQIRGCHAD
jgi:hypothetical protein